MDTLVTKINDSASPDPSSDVLPVAYVETDRYCDDCGYNLRTRPIHRDERTGILITRCNECGRYVAAANTTGAGQLWLQRLWTLLLGTWILIVGAAAVSIGSGLGGISYGTLDELTQRKWVKVDQPGGATHTSVAYEVREQIPYYRAFIALVSAGSFALAFLAATMAAVVFHHWRRWVYWPVLMAIPIVVNLGFVRLIWQADAPGLESWGMRYITHHTCVQLAGCAVGILAGRFLVRTVVRVVLPPRVRSALAFLWLVDNKPVPMADTEARSTGG